MTLAHYTHTHNLHTCTHLHTSAHTYTHTHTHICIHTHTSAHTQHTSAHTHTTHICTHTHTTHICTHTYTHLHTHIHTSYTYNQVTIFSDPMVNALTSLANKDNPNFYNMQLTRGQYIPIPGRYVYRGGLECNYPGVSW